MLKSIDIDDASRTVEFSLISFVEVGAMMQNLVGIS